MTSGLGLPAVMGEGLIGLGHLVRVLAALHRGARAVAGLHDLGGQLVPHRLPGARPRVLHARPLPSSASDYAAGLGRFAPYFDRPRLRSATPAASRVPRMMWYRIPGRSFTRPPRMRTTECSWRLWPIPGM